MQVKAIRLGFYGSRRKPGDVFDLVEIEGMKMDPVTKKSVPAKISPEEQFSSTWMVRVEAGKLAEASEPEHVEKKPFGAKKGKALGYSASLESDAPSPSLSTGDRKVI